MDSFSLDNITGDPLCVAVIVTLAVIALVGFSFGFQGHVQF